MNSIPSVIVSSTCYDLTQIRRDLHDFISTELGYAPLLSEYPSFPVDPDLDTVENCRRRVEQNADIMVLVIGGRYGSIDARKEKSITNIEFLAARAKGIPIYVFIEKPVLTLLPLWKSAPDNNYSAVVDTPKLFEFIDSIRGENRIWTFPFESAQDIITTLRIQFACLLHDSLKARQLLSGSGMPHFMETLRPKALRIALERPYRWEYLLFLQSWVDEVERRADLYREYKAALPMERVEHVPLLMAADWFTTQALELENYVEAVNRLLNVSLPEAIGSEGAAGNPEQIVWIATMAGHVMELVIRWAQRMRCARPDPPFQLLTPHIALLADDIITQFELFPRDSLRQVEEALASADDNLRLELTLTLTISEKLMADYEAALAKVNEQIGYIGGGDLAP